MASLSIKNIRSLVPLLDRVLIQRVKPESQTKSGIFLPSAADKTLPEATVIAAGPGARDMNGQIVPMSVKPGDKVLLPNFGGQTIKVEDEEYVLFRDAEILAKVSEGAATESAAKA